MNEQLNINGPGIAEEQLIDIYRTTLDQPSPWVMVSDRVMGGVSSAELRQEQRNNSHCNCLIGRTSLANNGGFVQMRFAIEPSCLDSDYRGIFIELYGSAHEYNLHIKTNQLTRPWQSFRSSLAVEPRWTRFIVPYEQLQAHRTDAELDTLPALKVRDLPRKTDKRHSYRQLRSNHRAWSHLQTWPQQRKYQPNC